MSDISDENLLKAVKTYIDIMGISNQQFVNELFNLGMLVAANKMSHPYKETLGDGEQKR